MKPFIVKLSSSRSVAGYQSLIEAQLNFPILTFELGLWCVNRKCTNFVWLEHKKQTCSSCGQEYQVVFDQLEEEDKKNETAEQ